MEPKTARTVKWTAAIGGSLLLLVCLYAARWHGVLSTIHVLICGLLITGILFQSGKGGGLAALGGMSDQSPFGARSSSALRHATYFLAGLFLLAALLLVKLPTVKTVSEPTAPLRVDQPVEAPKTPAPAPATPPSSPKETPADKTSDSPPAKE